MAGQDVESATGGMQSTESTPLIDAESDTTRLDHKDSVYSFMLFQPPISRRVHRHYLTVEVALAFALLVLNIILQVGLTFIAGSHILEKSAQFQTTLVSLDQATTPWEKVIDHVEEHSSNIQEGVAGTLGASPATSGGGSCCNGAECYSLGLPCCDRSGATPHTSHQPMRKNLTHADVQKLPGGNNVSFLEVLLGKPAAKKKKSDDEEQDAARVSSLCVKHGKKGNRTLMCTPSSYGFIDMWDRLDNDGDGMWTLEEARADHANLGCHLGLSVEEVFRSTCRGVQRDNEDTSENPPYNVHLVPLSVTERRSIPKAYFDWWRGLAVICVTHDVSRCGELISKGLFDGAIGAGHRFTKGGVRDLDSALDYCQRMLRPGGMCEKTLPGNYMTYRSRVAEKCGPAAYSTGSRYANPYDARDVMSTITVKYALVDEYTTASSYEFCFFQGLILFLWFVNLVGELKAIIQLGDFIYSFDHDDKFPIFTPSMRRKFKSFSKSISSRSLADQMDEVDSDEEIEELTIEELKDRCMDKGLRISGTRDELVARLKEYIINSDKDEDGNHVIKKISRSHKIMVTLMLITRVVVLVYMFHVGSMFLLTNHKYDDLLLNAVALAFIFELPEFLYTFLVSDEMKNDLEGSHTADYVTALPARGCSTVFFSKSLWGIVIIPVVVLTVVVYNYQVTTEPSLQALQCTCFQSGSTCDVASRFTRDWWNIYWKDIKHMFEQQGVFR